MLQDQNYYKHIDGGVSVLVSDNLHYFNFNENTCKWKKIINIFFFLFAGLSTPGLALDVLFIWYSGVFMGVTMVFHVFREPGGRGICSTSKGIVNLLP